MGRGRYVLERLADESDIPSEALPSQSIVEIAGERRVLIENHFGIKAYSQEKIVINVKFGFVNVCGCSLEILRMTKEQLIIRGRIDAVTLQRRERG